MPTGVLLAPIGNPEQKGLRPSGHPACLRSGYPSCFRTLDTLLPEQVKQVQRFARVAGRFLCLFYLTNIARTCDNFLFMTTHSSIICRTMCKRNRGCYFRHLQKLLPGKCFEYCFYFNNITKVDYANPGAAVKRSGTECVTRPLAGCSWGLGKSPTSWKKSLYIRRHCLQRTCHCHIVVSIVENIAYTQQHL